MSVKVFVLDAVHRSDEETETGEVTVTAAL